MLRLQKNVRDDDLAVERLATCTYVEDQRFRAEAVVRSGVYEQPARFTAERPRAKSEFFVVPPAAFRSGSRSGCSEKRPRVDFARWSCPGTISFQARLLLYR